MALNRPALLKFSCAECQQFVYDLETGERQKTCNGLVDVLRIKGPDGKPNTPCKECPKESPEREAEFILTDANRRTYQLYLEVQATAGARLTDAMRQDRWLLRNLAIVHRVVEESKQAMQARAQGMQFESVLSILSPFLRR